MRGSRRNISKLFRLAAKKSGGESLSTEEKQQINNELLNGVFDLNSHVKIQREGIWGIESNSLSLVGTIGNRSGGSTTTATVGYPTGIAAGDITVVAVFLDQSSRTAQTPAGWTLLGNGNTSEYPRSYVFARIYQTGDSDFSTTHTLEDNMIIAASFRNSVGISSFAVKNFVNDKGPSSLSVSLSNSSVTTPAIALAFLSGKTSQSPTMSWSGATVVTNTTDGGKRSMGYVLYDDGQTASHTITSNDTGRQSLSAMYLEISS